MMRFRQTVAAVIGLIATFIASSAEAQTVCPPTAIILNSVPYGRGPGNSSFNCMVPAANSILATNGSNVPSFTQTLPSSVLGNPHTWTTIQTFKDTTTATTPGGITTGLAANFFSGNPAAPYTTSTNPTVFIGRTERIVSATTAQSAALYVVSNALGQSSGGSVASQTQALVALAGKDAASTGDVVAVFGQAVSNANSSIGGVFGAFFQAIGTTINTAPIAIETGTVNGSGVSTTYNPAFPPGPASIGFDNACLGTYLGSSNANCTVAMVLRGDGNNNAWEVGIGVLGGAGSISLNSISKAVIQDDSSATNVFLFNSGAHSYGIRGTGATYSTAAIALPGFTLNGSGTITAGVWNGTPLTASSLSLTNTHIFVGNVSNIAIDAAMTGDATISNTGVLTLATVASSGTSGSSTAIPIVTINAKGLTTSITTAAVIAPAGTLTGATLASNVIISSLASVGTLTGGATGFGFTIALGSSTITGTLPLANGGAAAALTASNGGIVYSTASALAVLAGTATARQMLQSGASTTPAWSTTTWPATATVNRLLYASATNVISDLATANNSVLVTDGSGAPSLSTTLPNIAFGTPISITLTNASGTAASLTAGTATNAVNSGIANDVTTNATMFPTWVTANTGNLPLKVSSTLLSFNPSTGAFSVPLLISTGSGNNTFAGTITFSAQQNVTTGPGFSHSTSNTFLLAGGTSGYQFNNQAGNAAVMTLSNTGALVALLSVKATTFLQNGTTTVAGLPTCNGASEGSRYGVTDALAPTFLATIVGGGAVHTSTYCDGTNWKAD